MNVTQCPECKRIGDVKLRPSTEIRHKYTEIYTAAYCPDCGYSWWIVYTPDRTEDRD
jgi:ssDNA-binding Zn-finger/Zn-ribbon topoisomerase 1